VKLGYDIARTRVDEEGTSEQWFLTPFSIPDRDSQYAATDYQQVLTTHGIRQA